MPANEMYSPMSRQAAAGAASPVNECMTPRTRPRRARAPPADRRRSAHRPDARGYRSTRPPLMVLWWRQVFNLPEFAQVENLCPQPEALIQDPRFDTRFPALAILLGAAAHALPA